MKLKNLSVFYFLGFLARTDPGSGDSRDIRDHPFPVRLNTTTDCDRPDLLSPDGSGIGFFDPQGNAIPFDVSERNAAHDPESGETWFNGFVDSGNTRLFEVYRADEAGRPRPFMCRPGPEKLRRSGQIFLDKFR